MSDEVLTILFTDVQSSTALYSAKGDTEAQAVLAVVDQLSRQQVTAHGGRPIKSLGDGLMAVFSSPRRAVRCALAIQAAMADHGKRQPDQRLRVRAGLHTGEVLEVDGDLAGEAVAAAARICAKAKGGEVVGSEVVRQLCGSLADTTFETWGRFALKGFPERWRLYRILPAEAAPATRVPPGQAVVMGAVDAQPGAKPRGMSPEPVGQLIGRESELGALREALSQARSGNGGLVLVAGEPGIGKTRLAEELSREAADLRVAVIWGRGVEGEGVPPYWPWRQIVRTCLGSASLDLPADIAGTIPEIASIVPEAAPAQERGAQGAGPAGEERFRIFEAASRLLRGVAAAQGMVTVLDDLHLADPPSLLLLRHLARELHTGRLLVLATYRDTELGASHPLTGVLPELVRERGTLRLRLEGLTQDQVACQLASVTGQRFDPLAVESISERTQGNPFFVAELGRLLATDREGGRQDRRVTYESEVPIGIREVVGRRVERLSRPCQELLTVASVIGADFDVELLAPVAGDTRHGVLCLLDEACAARMVDRRGVLGTRYGFAHALVREAIHTALGSAERVRLHRAVAEHIETTHSATLDAHLAQLAHHWMEAAPGGHARRAAEVAELAADQAMHQYAYEEAARLYAASLAMAADNGATERSRVLLALATAHYRAGGLTEALAACEEAAAMARRTGDAETLARAALVIEGTGDRIACPVLLAMCDEALAALSDERPELRCRLFAQVAVVSLYTRAVERAEPASAKALALAERLGESEALIAALRARQMALAGPEGVDDRLAIGKRMLDIAETGANPWAVLWGRLWRSDAFIQRGDLASAAAEVERLAPVVDRLNMPLAHWHLVRARAVLAQMEGRFTESLAHAREALSIISGRGHAAAEYVTCMTIVGIVDLIGGEEPDELKVIREVADGDWHVIAVGARCYLALWFAHRGMLDEAERHYRRISHPDDTPPLAFLQRTPWLAHLALLLGDTASAAVLYEQLLPYGEYFVSGGAGTTHSDGSLHRVLGRLAAFLGRGDEAIAHFHSAIERNRQAGARPFVALAECDLANELWRCRRREQVPTILRLLDTSRQAATDMGMAPLLADLERLAVELRAAQASPLTRREHEVAQLVARGLTNRQMATALHLSERTAENHVEHILNKLGFSARTQIAAWVGSHGGRGPDQA